MSTVLVVMGVAGTGKTTIAEALQDRLRWNRQEGDELHSAENVAKMRAGTPLTDEDRWPWLHRCADVIRGWLDAGESGLLTCSALKRAYRDILVGGRSDVRLVFLTGDRALLEARMQARTGHYMPASLLDSQLRTLEPPGADERPITIDIAHSPAEIAEQVIRELALPVS